MVTSPYSIYVNKRPLRAAFLVEDKPESMPIIESVLAYSRDRWGGRYNAIVLTDGQTLSDAWWSLLESVDPDVVQTFIPLGDDLVGALERRISPYFIGQPQLQGQEGRTPHPQLPDDGLSLLPTFLNLRVASWAIAEPTLVLFQTNWQTTDPVIKQFTEWNFGAYSPPTMAVSRALEGVRILQFQITDAASLVAPLNELTAFTAFTYPIQLCSVPKEALPDVEYNRFGEAFCVVIGDAPSDVAYFWNRPATLPQWTRTYLKQVWLPVGVATNPQLTDALSSWIHRCADPGGNHQGNVRFVSLSLLQDELQRIVQPLLSNIRVFHDVHALPTIEPPKIREGFPGPPRRGDLDPYRGTSVTERLNLKEPDLLEGPHRGEHWMADLYIDFGADRYPNIVGRELWWQLPRVNSLTSHMFRRPSRVLRTRYPSVLMKRGEPSLEIQLLDDQAVFASLAVLKDQPYYTFDARYEKPPTALRRSPYDYAHPSEKGRYLSGLLDVFGGLYSASSTIEERYWRRLFALLSGRTAEKEADLLRRVNDTLRKKLRANSAEFYKNDRSMTWLTEYVLDLARSLPATSRELPFSTFEEHAKREMADFNAAHAEQPPWEYSRDDLLNALSGLTERGVLLMGIRARCPACGYRAWHHIDDAKQSLRCGGCNTTFPMPPERPWHYRLNSLVGAAYAEHGLLPVVLVLGQLLLDARSAFMFAPCLDLFEQGGEQPIGDLDIAVIRDGRFLIGEVKQSRDRFDEATFVKMEKIARRLLPDVLLSASMEREPTRLITKEIARLSEALRPLRIAVQWYTLHEYKFDASPVR
jgi:hypothetical protein